MSVSEIRLKEILVCFFCMTKQIDEDLTARINMGDYKFSFHERGKLYAPAWMSPEGKRSHAFFFKLCAVISGNLMALILCILERENRRVLSC